MDALVYTVLLSAYLLSSSESLKALAEKEQEIDNRYNKQESFSSKHDNVRLLAYRGRSSTGRRETLLRAWRRQPAA